MSQPTLSKSILLVDDAMVFCEAVAMALGREGYRTLIASNGREALDLLPLGVPDLIILDLLMPVLDGPSMLKKVRATAEWKHIPVLILTAVSLTQAKRDVDHLGVSAYLQKGQFSLADLVAKTRQILGEPPAQV